MFRKLVISCFVVVFGLYVTDAEAAKKKKVTAPAGVCQSLFNSLFKKANNKCLKAGGTASTCQKSSKKKATKQAQAADPDGDCAQESKGEDNCPGVSNADQADPDNDGDGTVCDNCPANANADQANTDGDAAGNACDNCVNKANDGQGNADKDAFGDACEICDLVVTSQVGNYSPTSGIYIFRDVLNNASDFISPDVEIFDTSVTAALNDLKRITSEGNLFATTDMSQQIFIYSNVTTVTDNQEPNLILDNAVSGLSDVEHILMHSGDLYVSNGGDSTVRIFRDIALDIPGGVAVAPDVILDSATSDIDSPEGIFIDSTGRLWVADDSDQQLLGFNSASTIVAAVAPSVLLDTSAVLPADETAFIDDPRVFAEANGCLFVLQGFESDHRPQLAFCPIASIASGDEADWVGNNGYSQNFGAPKSLVTLGNMTWLGTNNGPGIAGFETATPVGTPPQTLFPTRALGGLGIADGFIIQDSCSAPDPDGSSDEGQYLPYVWLAGSDRIATCGGVALFGASAGPCFEESWNSITAAWVYTNPNAAADGALPDKILWHPFMDYPKDARVIERTN